jgi:hypothetical protein
MSFHRFTGKKEHFDLGLRSGGLLVAEMDGLFILSDPSEYYSAPEGRNWLQPKLATKWFEFSADQMWSPLQVLR